MEIHLRKLKRHKKDLDCLDKSSTQNKTDFYFFFMINNINCVHASAVFYAFLHAYINKKQKQKEIKKRKKRKMPLNSLQNGGKKIKTFLVGVFLRDG